MQANCNQRGHLCAAAKGSVRHGTCFHHRLSTHHASAAPHSAVAELEAVGDL
jgi:hypothetical protein